MNIVKCDVCGVTNDAKPSQWNEPNLWRSISVQPRADFSPNLLRASKDYPGLAEPVETVWPGGSRWHSNWSPQPPLALHFCSEECLLDGLKLLHEGARVLSYDGFSLTAVAFHACVKIQSDLQEAAAMREP